MIYMQASPQYINSIFILLQVKYNFWSETSSLLLFASMQNLSGIHSSFVLLISAWHYSCCKLSRNILSWSWPFFLNVRHYMRLSLPLMPSLDHCDSILHNYIPSDGHSWQNLRFLCPHFRWVPSHVCYHGEILGKYSRTYSISIYAVN